MVKSHDDDTESVIDIGGESEDEKVSEYLQQEEEKYLNDETFTEFNSHTTDWKLEKLNALVQQSQVFSKIISETLLESSLSKKKQREAEATLKKDTDEIDKENVEPPRKKTRSNKKVQKSVLSFFGKKEVSEETKETKRKLEQANPTLMKQPSLVTGTVMRNYQLEGAEWLITLYENGLNGILADEMGLGKTLQCIALLAFLYEQGVEGPFLIAAPLSTVGNWINEIEKFTPTLTVLKYTGHKTEREEIRQKHFSRKGGFDKAIVVTSYETVMADRKYLDQVDWKFMIIDEGHRLKNMNCKLITELKKIRSQNRLLITGTPLQNNLNELWSLLNFILPDIFQDLDLFQKWFDFSSLTDLKQDSDESTQKLIDSKIQEALVQNLHTILKPFLLRRLKKNVLLNLVPKKEYIIYGTLTEPQKLMYKAGLEQSLKKEVIKFALRERIEATGERISSKQIENFLKDEVDGEKYDKRDVFQNESFFRMLKRRDYSDVRDLNKTEKRLYTILSECLDYIFQKKFGNLLMQLRLICDTPYLFYYPWDNEDDMSMEKLLESSAKFQLLDQLVPRLIEENHKVLVFCQFTSTMAFVQDWCDLKGYDHCYLAGDTDQADREEQIHKFNTDANAKVFVLSTRAGGLGLNLVSADSVILFDSDWNPQVDLQAMDRVHRIGQKNPVAIYRLILENTIEEVILAKADAKRNLEKLVIQMGRFESLHRLMNQDTEFGQSKGTTKDKRPKENMVANELRELLESKSFKHEDLGLKDNKLSEDELSALVDRSLKSYKRASGRDPGLPHIQFFESASPME